MSAPSPLAAPPVDDDTPRSAHPTSGESLLLRFLVQRGIVHRSLLKIIEIEHAGSGTTLSLVDWLVQRGHVSEASLASVLTACLTLRTSDLAPYALAGSSTEPPPTADCAQTATKVRHLTLVSSRPRASSDTPTAHASSSVRRRTPLRLPRKVRRLA